MWCYNIYLILICWCYNLWGLTTIYELNFIFFYDLKYNVVMMFHDIMILWHVWACSSLLFRMWWLTMMLCFPWWRTRVGMCIILCDTMIITNALVVCWYVMTDRNSTNGPWGSAYLMISWEPIHARDNM